MTQPHFVPLDGRGLDYVRDHLTGVNTLCTALFDVVTLEPGDIFTLSPKGLDAERLYRFSEGGILHAPLELVPDRLSDGSEIAPIESFKVEQAALLLSLLREQPDSVCIIDDFNPRWGERPPWLAESAFGVGEEVYHLFRATDPPSALITLLHQTDAVWHGVAAICTTAPEIDDDRECTHESLQAAAFSAIALTCTAYDREGFVAWRRAEETGGEERA